MVAAVLKVLEPEERVAMVPGQEGTSRAVFIFPKAHHAIQ
jgi:hypothetical protein